MAHTRKDAVARAREADRVRAAEKYAAMTPEEKRAYLDARKAKRKVMSPEQRALYNGKARARMARRYAELTSEQKAAKIARGNEARRARLGASIKGPLAEYRAMARSIRANARRLARALKEREALAQAVGRAAFARAMPSRELYRAIEAALPKLPKHMRDDAMSEIAILLLDGEIGFDGIESAARRYLNRENTAFGPLSLDAILPGSTSTTWLDMVPSDALHF